MQSYYSNLKSGRSFKCKRPSNIKESDHLEREIKICFLSWLISFSFISAKVSFNDAVTLLTLSLSLPLYICLLQLLPSPPSSTLLLFNLLLSSYALPPFMPFSFLDRGRSLAATAAADSIVSLPLTLKLAFVFFALAPIKVQSEKSARVKREGERGNDVEIVTIGNRRHCHRLERM